MKDTTELPANLLDGKLTPSNEPEDSGRITRVAQLADRGEHQAAARDAADLIEAGIYDVRVIGFYLFGLFLQRGISCLPALLGRVGTLVTDDLEALRPDRRKLQVVSSATARLFESISARLQFHLKQRDATWESWRAASDGALIDAIVSGCAKVTLALEAAIDAPLAMVPLARIRRLANDDLRRALARREATVVASAASAAIAGSPAPDREPSAPPAAVAVEEPPPDEPDEWPDEPDDDDEMPVLGGAPPAPRAPPPRAPAVADGPDDAVASSSPALAALQAKLRGFQVLVARGELARAAVVASDVRATLAAFDPVVFFPSMFAGYFKTLHQVIDDLTPYFTDPADPSWNALESYYRADMSAFFED